MSDDLAENALLYTMVTGLWSGEYNDEIAAFSTYYTQFKTDYWDPYIYIYLIEPYGEYVFSFLIGCAAVVNLGWTYFTDSGTNNIAIATTMAKGILRDQNLPGGYTLYGVFDLIIEKTAKGEVPAAEDGAAAGTETAAAE